jgi:hypothetical protein
MAESPRDFSGLGLDELKALLVQALEDCPAGQSGESHYIVFVIVFWA